LSLKSAPLRKVWQAVALAQLKESALTFVHPATIKMMEIINFPSFVSATILKIPIGNTTRDGDWRTWFS